MVDLLPSLYLDFGFLEQKLRATGLPNTIGDLQTYRTEIVGKLIESPEIVRSPLNRLRCIFTAGSVSRGLLLDELLNFLPNVEEMLKKSKDTCLLQYALMTRDYLNVEAKRQALQFGHRLFLEGR